jgi:hypothetical protein
MGHDPSHDDGKILDLTTVVGLSLKGKVHWKACINKSTPGTILLADGLVNLNTWPPWTNVLWW